MNIQDAQRSLTSLSKHHSIWASDPAISFQSCLLSASSLPLPSSAQLFASGPSASNDHCRAAENPRTWTRSDLGQITASHSLERRRKREPRLHVLEQRALVKATPPPSLCVLNCKTFTTDLPCYRAKGRSNAKTVCESALHTLL